MRALEEQISGSGASLTIRGRTDPADPEETPLWIRDGDLEKAEFEKFQHGRITLHVPSALSHDAAEFARALEEAADWTDRELGIGGGLHLEIYVIADVPRNRPVRFELSLEEDGLRFPVVLPPGAGSCWDLFGDNSHLIEFCFHELYECQLVVPTMQPTALPDLTRSWNGIPIVRYRASTRWFRDGLATYAAWLVVERAARDRPTLRLQPGFSKPMSELSSCPTGLLVWHQHSPQRRNGSFYPASFGLFLHLEDRFGREAIRRWINATKELDVPARRGLLASAEATFGQSLESILAGFRIPESLMDRLDDARFGDDGGGLVVDGVPFQHRFDAERAIAKALLAGIPEVTLPPE